MLIEREKKKEGKKAKNTYYNYLELNRELSLVIL
jgi:hypothetical protein